MTTHGADQFLVLAEAGAVRITCFSGVTIPVLLRTEEYAAALAHQLGLAPAPELDRRTVVAKCDFFIHEYALRTRVGDDRLMEEQMLHLLFRADVIRVVPASAGGSAAFGLDYTMIQYLHDPPVVYLANFVLATDAETVQRAQLIFDRLHGLALHNEGSREMLMNYLAEYDRRD
ncbi:hypothetical protein Lesp02_61440 [Lentzea sp. NBRC 105346]|uniref:DUF5753 domain-containing protein n=1 Tax=Lentzea sp. NBRC 105346 TaxID=3032205 RepID=UPI00255781E0|nr:DUF5753 domain-containing protein [Lentzea sp. NBRC 105346]GLZ33956.1 hypothetical protein Lesp02_61440 [Lentzea sp. NBRC 105346]